MVLHCPDSLSSIAGFFNGLSLAKLDHLGDIYAPGVEFHDPIHHAHGLADLRQVYQQIFQQLPELTVTVSDAHGDDRTGFLLWSMRFQLRGQERILTGTSHLKFAPDGRVAVQNDHWDPSFQINDELPLLGWAMRGIQRLVKSKTGSAT